MHRLFIALLRAGIAAAVLVGLFGQFVVIPTTAADEVDRFPPYAPFAVPYATVAIVGVACVQVALVAMWMLLSMVRRGAIFTPLAFRWVDLIIGSSVVATLLATGVTTHLALADIPSPDDGMEVISALAAATAGAGVGAAFAMLVVIMRSLLRKATELQAEMAEVV
ncbi:MULTISPECIES: DUF2975 domain-containing protein [Streptomyces]|uniref:DUF2975 domain-containing protein n=2 Tax=Streptomyces TaxID=1883 RepID=A0ABT9L7P8_9ACTN|nr:MULTISPECIES: DUF2975 domain-containing protein [Streptomyces]MBW8090900.1 DUF2975 domain-containing protein [Streptomyces hygroscopicus subsp. hygroscopicus]MCO8302192.1 DUF2975 domain-containing protein [Streptomyces sp. RKCA744]MDN3058641.1 DUF2975 domain-containing protein [Streptomyces sp. SRF1]MDP9615772.1 hypothetical protein [Streptomyces demainii]GHJ33675.1 hypothetical protein TPA0910_81080 [Streptomyces hygroscopicus]